MEFACSVSHSSVMHREICVKDYSRTAAPMILKFGTNIGYDYLHYVREIQHSYAYHSLYLSIFSFSQIKFVIIDFSATTSPTILKFSTCTNIRYDLLYCIKENKHPHACHSLHLSIFLSF